MEEAQPDWKKGITGFKYRMCYLEAAEGKVWLIAFQVFSCHVFSGIALLLPASGTTEVSCVNWADLHNAATEDTWEPKNKAAPRGVFALFLFCENCVFLRPVLL